VQVDSLTVANRRLTESVGGQAAAQDSLITALRVEVSSLRQKLWETELRAGVAEADRSAAESVLTRRQQREDAIDQVRAEFSPAEAEISLTAAGELVLRVHGLAFAVGSARVQAGQDDLLARLAGAIARFPGFTVDGHGPDRPVALNATPAGRALNRRIDVVIGAAP